MDIEVLGIRGLPQVKAGSDAVAAVHVAVWARFAAAHASVQGFCARDLRLLTRALGVPVLVCVCVCERERECVGVVPCAWAHANDVPIWLGLWTHAVNVTIGVCG